MSPFFELFPNSSISFFVIHTKKEIKKISVHKKILEFYARLSPCEVKLGRRSSSIGRYVPAPKPVTT